MIPAKTLQALKEKIKAAEYPRELAVEVLFLLQRHYGYLSDTALKTGSDLLGLTLLELEELATFYDFLFRDPVGHFVIHVCDSTICWMFGGETILDYISRKLGIIPGGTTEDGLFSLLPVSCIGFCDRAPAMLINGNLYGPLTPEVIDDIFETLRKTPV
jgi:NADH-quinone oxidoreductase subunit E